MALDLLIRIISQSLSYLEVARASNNSSFLRDFLKAASETFKDSEYVSGPSSYLYNSEAWLSNSILEVSG